MRLYIRQTLLSGGRFILVLSSSQMKVLKFFLKLMVGLYVLGCICLYLAQENIIFLPDKLPDNYSFRQGLEVEVTVAEDISLNCLLIKDSNPSGVILYLHGNKGSNARCLRQAERLMGLGYDIFMPDYRGFGKSDGSIRSERQLLSDAQIVYDYVKSKYDESSIVVVGYSLGTGIASYLAAHNDPQQVILNSPFVSFIDLKDRRIPFVPDFLVKYPLDNAKHLKNINEKVTLFHGTDDELIPYDSSQKLVQIDPQKIKLIPLENSGHRRAIFHQTFSSGVSRLLQ